MTISKFIRANAVNAIGWRTKRHLVVIESDDWGSVRMPSREVYVSLIKKGIRVDRDAYCRVDSLESPADLSALYEALATVKDSNGRHAVFTANCVVANPDFEKIEEAGYTKYYYEPYTETRNKYGYAARSFNPWEEGISHKMIRAQFHGREHLSVTRWLKALREGEWATRVGFDYGTFGLTEVTDPSIARNYMAAFDSSMPRDVEEYHQTIAEGLTLFQELFRHSSRSFIAPAYTWSPTIEPFLEINGIRYLQGLITQRIPLDDGTRTTFKKTNFQGTRNRSGQLYLSRNCFFEPAHHRYSNDVVDDCLRRVAIAFRWGKAAVICSHRLNFIGSIDPANRDKSLSLLRVLLGAIVRHWPDVEFLSTDELGTIVDQKESH